MGFLVCNKCGGYYELQKGEVPEDFADRCECGGKLEFKKTRDVSNQGKITTDLFNPQNVGILALISYWLVLTIISGIILSFIFGFPWGIIAGGLLTALCLFGFFIFRNSGWALAHAIVGILGLICLWLFFSTILGIYFTGIIGSSWGMLTGDILTTIGMIALFYLKKVL